MKSLLLNIIDQEPTLHLPIQSEISFAKYITTLESKAASEKGIRKQLIETVITRLKKDNAFSQFIPLDKIAGYEEQLSLIYHLSVPPLAFENEMLWALCTPANPTIFFGTEAFYNLTSFTDSENLSCQLLDDLSFTMEKKIQVIYSYILEKIYGFASATPVLPIISIKNGATGLQKFYRLNIQQDYIDIIPTGKIPNLNHDQLTQIIFENPHDLKELIPLDLFRFEGFSIMTLTEITSEQALVNIKNTIVNRLSFNKVTYFNNITDSLKTISETPNVKFGMMPLIKVNNKVVFNQSAAMHSKLLSAAMKAQKGEQAYLELAEEYFKAPKPVILKTIESADPRKYEFIEILRSEGIQSYAIIPIYSEKNVVGVLEVFSENENVIDAGIVQKLEVAIPLLAQVMLTTIDEFDHEINTIIRDKFTSLHPAVEWKFKEVAWHYAREKAANTGKAFVENIKFKDVYPLYGAIDIRNSTIERNNALRGDLTLQFAKLADTFLSIKQNLAFGLADEMVYKCKKWLEQIEDTGTDIDEAKVKEFLDHEAHPFLNHFRKTNILAPGAGQSAAEKDNDTLEQSIEQYFALTDEASGEFYTRRRLLETSMQKINSAVNSYLDFFKQEIQTSYPTYFEKFRTDGIEYDIYIGQSIQPGKPFSDLYLKNIRLWQLTSMAAIARITHSLLDQMDTRLQTTQLIFINPATIDISFRDDERRFDVEGAYNIRYQIIKKRIDKVHIKATGERLTQPGKIAMVYFNEKAAEEYISYIGYLQQQNMLLDDMEMVDLEELQGVNGLKALRVGINLHSDWN